MSSALAAKRIAATAFVALAMIVTLPGCEEKKEQIIDIETPRGEVEVERDKESGDVDVEVKRDKPE